MSDLVILRPLGMKDVVHDTECPYLDLASQKNIDSNCFKFSLWCSYACFGLSV